MRRNRMIWICLWVLSLVGISFWGGTVSYGLFAALTLVPIFSLLYLLAVYILFHIYQNIGCKYVTVDEVVQYNFSLVNECPLLFVGIRVNFFSAFSSIATLDDEPEYELLPDTRIERQTNLICHYRGEYEVGIKDIEIQDYFRLFKIRYKNKECVRVVVKPRLLKLERLGKTELSDAVRLSEQNKTELDAISRKYVSGDDQRLINWSQSARTATLMTRNRTGNGHQEIAVVMDTFRSSTEALEFIPVENKILEITLAVSYYFSRNSIEAAVYYYQEQIIKATTGNSAKFDEFYEMLSDTAFDKRNIHQLLREALIQRSDIFNSSMVFFILSSWDSEAEKLLSIFEENALFSVICFVTDDEKSIPDLSHHNRLKLMVISPYDKLLEDMG